MTNAFKIGDYIIGKAADGSKPNPYFVTYEGWRGVVSDVRESGLIEVQPIRTIDEERTDETYIVRPEYFDKCTKFLVGDIVVGNDEDRYCITKKGWKGEVTKLFEDGEITVTELVAKGTTKRLKFDVEPEYFDLVKPAEYVKQTEKDPGATSHKQFKVGDIVIGNKLADDRYGFTKTGWKGKVVVSTDKYGQFKAVRADNPSDMDGVKFSLNSEYFDLYEAETETKPTQDAPAQTYKVTIRYTEGAKQASYTVTKGLSTLDDKTVSFKNESASIGAIVRRIADKIKEEETKYSTLCVGDRVVVTKNTGRHAFEVGQIVQCNNAAIPTFKRESDDLVQTLSEDEYIKVIE